ncbi:MAG: OmpP1/FadL family transporter [bacterium]
MSKISPFSLMSLLLIPGLMFLFCSGEALRPSTSYADYPDMKMNATPNPVGSGARAMGLGGAFISVADDATAASWNPAGLLQLTKPEFSVAGSWFSGRIDYQPSEISGDGRATDLSPDIFHLNYASLTLPFVLARRNMVFSLNYQHLYEFSMDNLYTWTTENKETLVDTPQEAYKSQRGSLNTLSPALAFQVTPSLYVGLTANFWPGDIIDNGWENLNIIDGEGITYGRKTKIHTEFYERYSFSGFNLHLGFLYTSNFFSWWGRRRLFRIGGVVKTPFKADIDHEHREVFYEEYPENPVLNSYVESSITNHLTLKMPLSYGLGASLDISDSFSISLDCYRTHWEKYLIRYPSGREYSPISRKPKEKAHIKPTTQIRMGLEYLIQRPERIIPLRAGAFYDPEPAEGSPDDFFGVSLGTGISYRGLFSLDGVYQYRFGRRKEAESMQGEKIPGHISQHYLTLSLIYYLF